MNPRRYDDREIQSLVQQTLDDGFVVLRGHFPPAKLRAWRDAFAPLLERHVAHEGHQRNRGAGRYYVTLPFAAPFADPAIFEDDDVLAVVEGLVGAQPVMPQLATDTPVLGSEYQDVHRDTPPLFPETGRETPPFQLAVNFPLVDVTADNGPLEVARGTHVLPRDEALRRLASGRVALEPVHMALGDVIVRDVRGLHRGTPNRTATPRPMVVIGYSRRWLFRPEVSIRVPRPVLATLSPRARELLRYNPVFDSIEAATAAEPEVYQAFAY
jgi:ectoine hydroxylase-related dioxygenase (phytanoyl-CoA dioxygenase family)